MATTHDGRVAVVTGAGRGIGQAIAATLSERGARVVLVDLKDPSEAAQGIAGETLSLTADVSDESDWKRIADATIERFGSADIVVNNAGIYPLGRIEDIDHELWRKVMSVNLDSHFFSAKAFVPLMRENGWGRFVNISSNSIGVPQDGMSHYMASKMGVIGFVRGLANDVGTHGITVNAVLPSFTATPGTAAAPDEMRAIVVGAQAIKRLATPQDLVGTISFLSSDDAAFITGQAVVVDGGLYKISQNAWAAGGRATQPPPDPPCRAITTVDVVFHRDADPSGVVPVAAVLARMKRAAHAALRRATPDVDCANEFFYRRHGWRG